MADETAIDVWDDIPSLNREAMHRALQSAAQPVEEGVGVMHFHAGLEAFGCPELLTVTEPGAEPLRGGTISRTDGHAHTVRRPLITRVTVKQARLWLEGGHLESVATRVFGEADIRPTADGRRAPDLVPVAKRIFTELAASLAGLRGYEDRAAYEELSQIREDFGAVVALRFARDADERTAILARSARAMRRYEELFYEPSLRWHQEFLEKHRQGLVSKSDLPSNLIMLIAAGADPYYTDRGNCLRETLGIMNAASDTAAATLVNTFAELEDWYAEHPEDLDHRDDPDFLFRAVAENLRLHSAFPVFARRAATDVTLQDGTAIRAGQRVSILMHEAGRDPEVFGDDAGSFNPHRSIPADAPPYGLGFGSGPHMCAGRSFVLGWHGTDGAVAYLLRWLYRRDAMRDRGATPEYCSDFDLDKWDSYPITMAADAEIGAGAPARS